MNECSHEKETTTLVIYDMIGADKGGVHGHPQKVMRDIGLNFIRSECCCIADAWIFELEKPVPKSSLPKFISPSRTGTYNWH